MARSVERLEAVSQYNKQHLARRTARPWEGLVRSDPRSVPLEMPAIIGRPPEAPARDIRILPFIRKVDLLRVATLRDVLAALLPVLVVLLGTTLRLVASDLQH